MPNTSEPPQALTAHEVAKQLRVSYRKVLDMAANGEIASFLVGTQYRFTQAAVNQYIRDHPAGGKK